MAGLTKAGSTTKNDADTYARTSIGGVTDSEQQLRDSIRGYGASQQNQLNQLFSQYNQFQSPGNTFALNSEELAQLNQAYSGAEADLRRRGQIMGQDLAGTRGLNTSDTPVSEAVLREYLPAAAMLQGQKMQTGLGMKLQHRGLNLSGLQSWGQATQYTPTATLGLADSMQRDRLAQTTSSTNQRQSLGMPWINRLLTVTEGFKNIGQGMQGMSAASDERLKRDITPVSWKWNVGEGEEYLGVIAQDLQQSHPHLVSQHPDGHLQVDYGTMVAMLLNERAHLYARLEARG